MKLGLSPIVLVSLLGSVGCATSTAQAPVEPAQCRVLLAVEENNTPKLNVDLGAGSCDRAVGVVASRNHTPGGYFFNITIGGTVSDRFVSSHVARFHDRAENSDDVSAVLRSIPGAPTSGTPAPPPNKRPVVAGAWNEIAAGEWPDATPYRVLVRIEQT